MKIYKWLEEVNKYNFPSEERQKELAWTEWACSTNNLDGTNRYAQLVLEKLNKDIQERYDVCFSNRLQKENFGGTFTTYHLSTSNRKIDITKQDWTMMYRYNVYEDGKLLKEAEEIEDLVLWLNENL